MLERAQHIRAETSLLRSGVIEAVARKYAGEKLLSQFTGGVFIAAFPTKEAQHRLVIGLTQLAEGGAGLRRFTPSAHDERPARRGKWLRWGFCIQGDGSRSLVQGDGSQSLVPMATL